MSVQTIEADILILLDSPIAFHRVLVDVCGSVTAALLLSQILYWSKRTKDPDGWFWKTQEGWKEETGLSRYEQESARACLRKLGLLEEKKEAHPPTWRQTLFFRLNKSRLIELLNLCSSSNCCFSASKDVEIQQTRKWKSNRQESGNPPSLIKESEITPETTPGITEREQSTSPVPSNNSPGSLSVDTQFPSHSSPAPSSDLGPFSDSQYQRNRFHEWVKDHWESLQQEYLPYFQNNVDLLRWSLNKCIAWAFDNADKARKFSNPGMRIRKWLDEEDVDRLIRAVEGQGRAAQRVAATEASRTDTEADYIPDLDSKDIVGLVAHYHKIFGLFQEFARDFFSRSFEKSDWDNLEEDIRSNPEKYAERSNAGFSAMYNFFGVKSA